MQHPVTIAGAVAVFLLAALGPGLSLAAEDHSETDFSRCSHCFYRQTPPVVGASVRTEATLQPLCHSLPGGQTSATLYDPACATAVFRGYRLSHGWVTERGEEEGAESELVTENGDDIVQVAADSPVQLWDSWVTALVRSQICPQCDSTGGDLYILTGRGRPAGSAEDGDEGTCETGFLWTAVCCSGSENQAGFSVGLVRELGVRERLVDIRELEEMLGGVQLFSEGCGGADGEAEGGIVDVLTDALSEVAETVSSDDDTVDEDSNENIQEGTEGALVAEGEQVTSEQVTSEQVTSEQVTSEQVTSEQVTSVLITAPLEALLDDITPETSTEEVISQNNGEVTEEEGDATLLEVATTMAVGSLDDNVTVDALETDTNSSSTLLYILTTSVYLITAPIRPVVSIVTQLPGQVTYILQEDLGVLCALPGNVFSLFHLMGSDLVSGVWSVIDTVVDLGEDIFSGLYLCTSPMLQALLSSCHLGMTGLGTLACDAAGIVGGAVDNVWWVIRFVGGRLWEQIEEYAGAVLSEMGGQAKAVGGGLGTLAWRGGNGVGNVLSLSGRLAFGTVEMLVNTVIEVFGPKSE